MGRKPTCTADKSGYTCGLEAALDVIGGKWKALILWHLHDSPKRFGELRRDVAGISEKMLIQHLKQMEADNIVSRKDYQEVPPRVEYSMTSFGISLCEAVTPLCEWGEQHMERIESCKAKVEEQRKAAEIDTLKQHAI
jgi:DNA-binding HxlR family transcriptional regulator